MSEHPAINELREAGGVMWFDPARIFYFSEGQLYFVDTGNIYRRYKSKAAVKKGIVRYLDAMDAPSSESDIATHFEAIEIDRAVDAHGGIAGYKRGLHNMNGSAWLVTESYHIPDPVRGQCPLIMDIINQAFPNPDARAVFHGFMKGGVNAIRVGIHQPAPMLVMAGERNAGKSLLAYIMKIAFGGRVANPMSAWAGDLIWNDSIARSEFLCIDDSVASTDPRKRKALGARFKEMIYAGDVEIHTRNKSSISMRPVQRVAICCNCTPENLSVIPPLEDGIEDKIALLMVSPITPPMPATHPDERKAFQDALIKELPRYLYYLEQFVVPEHLGDPRSGITAWKDQALLEAVTEISPEGRLENLLALAISKRNIDATDGDVWMTATEIQEILQDRDGATAHQANTLLKFDMNAGRYLSALAKAGSEYVKGTKKVNGITHYRLSDPRVG